MSWLARAFDRIHRHPGGVRVIVTWFGGGGKVCTSANVQMHYLGYTRGDDYVLVHFAPEEVYQFQIKKHRKVVASWSWRPTKIIVEFEDAEGTILLQERYCPFMLPGDVLRVDYEARIKADNVWRPK